MGRPRPAGSRRPGSQSGSWSALRRAGPLLLALAAVMAAALALLALVDRGARTAVADAPGVARTTAVPATTPGPTAPGAAPTSPSAAGPVSAAPTRATSPPIRSPDGAGRASGPARPAGAAEPARAAGSSGAAEAVAVLTALDHLRSAAFATGNLGALAAVYPPGSPLLAQDRALYERLVPRGGALVGLGFEFRDAVVLHRTPGRLVVQVGITQRPAEVVRPRGARLPIQGGDLGRMRVDLTRATAAAPWTIAASTPIGRT